MARARATSGFDGSRAEAASITLLAVAILSLGSVPATVAAAPDDFFRPTYPSDASFCISEELNSAEDLPASPLKWRAKLSSCAAIVSTVAFELWARLWAAPGSAVKS